MHRIQNARFTAGDMVALEIDDGAYVASAFVRFAEGEATSTGKRARLVITEILAPIRLPEGSAAWRWPTAAIERWANQPDIAEQIRKTFGTRAKPMPAVKPSIRKSSARTKKAPGVRIAPPAKRHVGDDYYVEIAKAYGTLAQTSRKPVEELAALVGRPVPTVRGWIREARRRGHLNSGKRGTAG